MTLHTIKKSADFQLASKQSKRWSSGCFTALCRQREDSEGAFRLGLTASRKVGGAVVRNRAKRRLREVVRAFIKVHGEDVLKGLDIVIIARTACATAPYDVLVADFAAAMIKFSVATK